MRIIKFFLLSLLSLLMISSLIFLLGREIILLWGAKTLQAHYRSLQSKNYSNWCVEKFTYAQEAWTQLRFVSNKAYQLEVVCADFTSTPLLIASYQLPPFLAKNSGGTGFIKDERNLPFFLELSIFGRSAYLYLEDQQLHFSYTAPPDLDYQAGPLSSCQAHGFTCCRLDVENGVGNQLTQVLDCPKSCYQSCLLRPLFLSFNSNPSKDAESQVVEINGAETLTFSYVLGNGKEDVFAGQIDQNASSSWLEKLQTAWGARFKSSQPTLALPALVTITFGDGQTWQSQNLQDTVDHRYVCQTSSCYFQAQISAQDAQGARSLDNETNQITVKVRQ